MKILVVVAILLVCFASESTQEARKPKKSVVDMTDAEIEKLAEEWDVGKS